MRRTHVMALVLASALPGSLCAQGGTVTWSLRGTVPDTVQKVMPGAAMRTFDLNLTAATDGRAVSVTIAPGPDMIANSLTVDLSTTRLYLLTHKGSDSITIGVVLPGNIAAMMGSDLGFRLDLPLPDSLPVPATLDTLDTTNPPELTNTGRSDTVAGVGCEIWTVQTKAPDTTAEFCFAENPPVLSAFRDAMGDRYAKLIERLTARSGDRPNPFGGRTMIPVRLRVTGDGDFTMELTAVSTETPPAAAFLLPEGLQPFPVEMLQGMKGT